MMMHRLKSLKAQISLFYMLISLVTISVLGVILYIGISQVVLKESIQTSKMAINKSASFIEMYVDRLKVLSEMLADNPLTLRTLSSDNKSGQDDVMQLIRNVLDSDPYIQSVIIIGKDGDVLSNETNLNMDTSANMMKEPWYQAALENGGLPVLTSARMQKFSMDKNNWVISMSREIKDKTGGNLGVVLLDIKYKGIEDALSDLELGQRGFAFIVNHEGEIVYHKNPVYFMNEKKRIELLSIFESKEGYDKSGNTLVYKSAIKHSDWTLVGVSSLDGLVQIRGRLLGTILAVGLGLFVLILIVTPILAKTMTSPITRLERAMQKVKSGVLEVSVTEKGCTEVLGLSQHFNSMVLEIKRLMREMEKKEKDLRTYELSVLHGQINPHFLYNTLDTIVWMAEFNDSERVISITKALAKFFQLSLSGGSEFTTIGKEIDHVGQYLYIQKERYGDKLTYSIELDPALSDLVIPKIVLQPLAENALYHGIREKAGKGHLRIACQRESPNRVLFMVEDDGAGFDPEMLIDSSLPMEKPLTRKRTRLSGVGIRNVDQRLKLYYGEEYGVRVQSTLGRGTTVRIVIPEQRIPSEDN